MRNTPTDGVIIARHTPDDSDLRRDDDEVLRAEDLRMRLDPVIIVTHAGLGSSDFTSFRLPGMDRPNWQTPYGPAPRGKRRR